MCTSALQVKIMKDFDTSGRRGPKMPLPDVVKVIEPKDDEYSMDKHTIMKDIEP